MKLALLILYLLMILAVIFAERKSPTEALLWVLVLVCLPYVGMILYLVFGSTMSIKLTAWARKKRLRQCRPDLTPVSRPDASALGLSEEDAQVARFNRAYNHSELASWDSYRIYTDGESHYRQLFTDIRQAKTCIYIEFYTIQHDRMGEEFVKILTEKAREGVRVMVLCDFIANVTDPPKMFRPLRQAGGRVIRVKPFLTHYRSHRKIVVIDHEISYIGGMNIGVQYANMGKKKNPWRDTQIRMTGSCCAAVLDEYFLTDWLCSIRRRDWDQTVAYLDSLPQCSHPLSDRLCQFIVGGVDTNRESVKMCYLSMIRSARHSIRIQTPYFIPDASILDALKTAAAAGVRIDLMIPGIKASFFLDPVTTYYSGQLLEFGAHIHKYRGYIHAKTMVIDDEICCIGSVNMDMRSLQVDDEICGVFYTDSLVQAYNAIYDRDIAACDPYTQEQYLTRSAMERFQEGFFLLFAPLM